MTQKDLEKKVNTFVKELAKSDLDVTCMIAINIPERKKKRDKLALALIGDIRLMHHLLDEMHDGIHEGEKMAEAKDILKELRKKDAKMTN